MLKQRERAALGASYTELTSAYSEFLAWWQTQNDSIQFTDTITLTPDQMIVQENRISVGGYLPILLWIYAQDYSGLNLIRMYNEAENWESLVNDHFISLFPIVVPALIARMKELSTGK